MNTSKIASKKLLSVAPLAGLLAAAINAILFYVGKSTGWISDTVLLSPANEPMTVVPVIISSIMPTIFAGGVLALLNRFTASPLRIFNIIAAILLLLSFTNPFIAIPNVPLMMGVWLNVMHIVVAGIVVFAFNRFTHAE